MNHEKKRAVTIEDLLHLKRTERPPAEFWTHFERDLRAKQLAALVEKRPWWRTLPPSALGRAERLLLQATLEQIGVLHGGDEFAAALAGDPTAAIGVAFSLMPIEELSLTSDIAITVLLQCALEPNATAALVLAQVLGLTDLDHSKELAASWLAYGRLFSDKKQKFGDAAIVLLSAFREISETEMTREDPDFF